MRRLRLVCPLLALVACGDDGNTVSDSLTSGLTPGPLTSSDPTANPPTSGDTQAETAAEGGATAVVTGEATSDTTSPVTSPDPSTSTSSPSTTAASNETGAPDTSTGAPDTGSTGPATTDTTAPCACTPGDESGCDGNGQLLVCQDDCQTVAPEPCPLGSLCLADTCVDLVCVPNSKTCEDADSYKACDGDGQGYGAPVPCGATETCAGAGECISLCAQAEAEPSTVGCSFFASRMDNFYPDQNDSFVIGNVSKSKAASVQFYFTPNGTNVEQPQGGPVLIQPGQTSTYTMTNPPMDKASGLRKGGAYRAQSTIPVIAYQHSPIFATATNDASVLFPEHALRSDYVIASYADGLNQNPSYFFVIARDDDTKVEWTPTAPTLAGAGVAAVAAGQTGMVTMNRFDNLQVRTQFSLDLSGTVIHADKPVWVIGAVECARVPTNITYCDHIEEQMLALDYWGKTYVGAHSPKRGNEKHYWRVYGGEDGTTITTNPAQPGTPFMINKGQWKELVIPNNTSFLFTGDKPFLPVQYLESQNGGAGTGDPAMYQMIPVEQFLDRYAFVTGTGYSVHYAQILRPTGGPDVLVDGAVVGGYYSVGGYDIADWKISEGAHLAESAAPFGILNIGYTNVTSYAYPGGLKLAIINPQ